MKPSRAQFKSACFWLSLLPLLSLLMAMYFQQLGANPVQAIHTRLGDWALRFLCLTLAITPLQAISKWRGMAEYRQLFGLYCFFYASLHLLVYLLVDFQGQWPMIGWDILESPYLWLGLTAYFIVFLLALSSPNRAKKYLGIYWKKLHRFIYLAAISALLHYLYQLKGNMAEPLFYLALITLLLLFRVINYYKNRQLSRLMIPTGRKKSLDESL